jgi:hypothetical protein
MPVLYAMIIAALAGAAWFAVSANDAHNAVTALEYNNNDLRTKHDSIEGEIHTIEALSPMPLRYDRDAVSEFVNRTTEAGETLGAGLRVVPAGDVGGGSATMVTFTPVRPGLDVAHLVVSGAIEGDQAAPAVMTLLEEGFVDMPVAVTKAKVILLGKNLSVTMDVDVPGRVK